MVMVLLKRMKKNLQVKYFGIKIMMKHLLQSTFRSEEEGEELDIFYLSAYLNIDSEL